MPNTLFTTNNKSLGSQIFELLRDRILTGEYESGYKLNEIKLSKELEISRTPIREALKQLELEGLVESIPNTGVYVRGFSPRDIDDMFEIRVFLEGLAVGKAIERMTEDHLSKIEELFELMEFYTYKKDIQKIDELNILYHEAIYDATQSSYLTKILKDLHYYVSMTSRFSIKTDERLQTSLEEHRDILNKIKEKDITGAKESIEAHIRETQLLVRNYYNQG